MDFKFRMSEYVNATSIWPGSEDHEDIGTIPGLVRGYNIEVRKKDKVDWVGAEWFSGEPEEVLNDEYHIFHRETFDLMPTGRISFRGYGREEWDPDEREMFIIPINDQEAKQIAESLRAKETS